MLAFSGVMLAYLAGALALMFGAHRRNAIPVLLAGTAWPLLGTAQWFAAAALALPVATAIAGALYHHLRWRLYGGRRDWAVAAAWTVVGLLFSQQAILIPPVLLICAVVAREDRLAPRAVMREVVGVLPLLAPALALQLYVSAQSWASTISLPSLTEAVTLVRVIVVRALLPALAGVGMDGAPPDSPHEVAMRALATAVLGIALVAALWLRRRWCAAPLLAISGAILTAVPIALARLSTGVTISGSEPRYLLPSVLLGALAIGALLTPQRKRSPRRLPAAAVMAVVIGVGWTAMYLANLNHTYHARRVVLDFAQAARKLTLRLERSLHVAVSSGQADAIVDGTLPYPLFYMQASGNLRSAYRRFFIPQGIAAPGVPTPSGLLLSITSSGALQRVGFRPIGRSVTCLDDRPCVVPAGDLKARAGEPALSILLSQAARTGDSLHYLVEGPPGASPDRTLAIPAGARQLVVPATFANPQSVVVTFAEHPNYVRSVRAGTLQPT